MDGSKLTPEQAQQLHDAIGPTRGYLERVIQRMDETGFPHDDKLRRLVTTARDALHSLTVALHYQSCGVVVGGMIGAGGGMTKQPPPAKPAPTEPSNFDAAACAKADYERRRRRRRKR